MAEDVRKKAKRLGKKTGLTREFLGSIGREGKKPGRKKTSGKKAVKEKAIGRVKRATRGGGITGPMQARERRRRKMLRGL